MNPEPVIDSPLGMTPGQPPLEYGGEVYRLACLELRGGNHSAEYGAELPGLAAWVSCRPLQPSTHGGDLYYLSVCSQGSIARVALADVAGHGDSVSAAAVRLREALREHVDHWDQSALIRQLNDSFFHNGRQTGAYGKFATAFVLSHCNDTNELLFTNAGHWPPLWYRAAQDEWTFMQDATPYAKDIADLPLGMIPGTAYTQTAVQLAPGDLVLLYTDGVTESRDSEGNMLGLEGLREISRRLPHDSPITAAQTLRAAVAEFRGSTPAEDDETVIALYHR